MFAKACARAERDFGLETETETWVVSVSVSSLETPIQSLSISLNSWDQIEESQSQTLILSTISLGLNHKK